LETETTQMYVILSEVMFQGDF